MVELDPVVRHVEREHLRPDLSHERHFRVPEAEKVEVTGGAMRCSGPQREQSRSLEHEAAIVSRCR
jgi:hypothetical protein